jgi:hypothetical protein
MAIYTVHAPADAGIDARTSFDQLVFVRDGFYFWAFAAAIIWLIWHRLWLALFGYIVLTLAIEFAFFLFDVPAVAQLVAMTLIAVLVGFEAASLWRWKLSRRRWRQLDVVVAENEEAAERRFLDRRKTQTHESGGNNTSSSLPRTSSMSQPDVIGLFPQPGAPR